jgi:chemotaxis protein MotB
MAKVQADVRNAERIIKANKDAITLAGGALASKDKGVVLDSATGTLIMNSELLFDYGSARLKPAAMSQIQGIATDFLPRLIKQPSVDSLLQEIVVEGHTDTVGTYLSNLQLSQQRAYSVMNALVESTYGMSYAPRLRSLIVASGKSEVRPVQLADGHIDAAKSRRIEIHLRFKDDAILKKLFESINTAPPTK